MRRHFWSVSIFVFFLFSIVLSGCSSWWKKDQSAPTESAGPMTTGAMATETMTEGSSFLAPKENSLKYSETPQAGILTDRQYRRMTRVQLEEQSELNSAAGSLWSMEGQGAYLFAQNKSRKEGDVLGVRLEGPAMKQVETKVRVIKQLLAQLEAQLKEVEEQKKRALASIEGGGAHSDLPANSTQGASASVSVNPNSAKSTEKTKSEEENLEEIKMVSTKIVERMSDGNYRVKGSQPFMIGKREYKVIVAGVVRAEDFNDDGISSQKLLDPQFDVVSIRRSESQRGEVR